MKYLIIPSKLDLDSIVAMYSYYKFVEVAGFDVSCYLKQDLSDEIKKILEEFNIKFQIKYSAEFDDNIIILNNSKFYLPQSINAEQVTEIISLKSGDFSKYNNANIKIEQVALVTTIIIERYREYKLKPSDEIIALLIYLYDNCKLLLKDRDKISKDYLKLMCK